jgi:hypothetical protein
MYVKFVIYKQQLFAHHHVCNSCFTNGQTNVMSGVFIICMKFHET